MFAMKSKFVFIVVGAEHEDIWNSWIDITHFTIALITKNLVQF